LYRVLLPGWRPAGRTANLYIMPVIIVIYQAIDWQLSAGMHFRPIAVP
jgi:hypothetical protein